MNRRPWDRPGDPSRFVTGRRAGIASILLLASAVAGVALGVALLHPAPWTERTGADALPHLSLVPDALGEPGTDVGSPGRPDAVGPGQAYLDADAVLRGSSGGLLFLVALLGALGQLALAGVVTVARRGEVRLRRAVGAPRRELLQVLALGAVGRGGGALLLGVLLALAVGQGLDALWFTAASVPGGAFTLGPAALAASGGALVAWAGIAGLVVWSGELVPGGSLRADTALDEPFRGERCHPAVPVLQVATAVVILVGAGLLERGAAEVGFSGDALRTADAGPAPEAGALERWVVEADPRHPGSPAPELLRRNGVGIDGADGTLRQGLVAVTSPGFWEGVGVVAYAQTECGICYMPGSPPVLAPLKGEHAVFHTVSPDTFEIAGIRLLSGRLFALDDDPRAPPVAVVTAPFAARNFQDGDALGRQLRIGRDRDAWITVVGVVEPRRRRGLLSDRLPPEEVFLPITQRASPRVEMVGAPGLDPGDFEVREWAPFAARARELEGWVGQWAGLWRGAGGAAVLLAVIGTVLTVGRRVREEASEIALRRALGARRSRLLAARLGFGLGLGAAGSVLGLWASLFLVSLLAPELLGDAGALLQIGTPPAIFLTAAAGAAAYLTARRGARGSPVAGLGR